MPQTSPPAIAAPPAAPSRGDRSTFSGRVDAFVSWMVTAVDQFGAVASNVYANAVDAYSSVQASAGHSATALDRANSAGVSAGNADASKLAAQASADQAAASTGAGIWVSGANYALGAVAWSPVNRLVYRRIVAGSGATDPSGDAANWAMLGVIGLTVVAVSATTAPAMSGGHYVLTNAAATTVTLAAAPSSGDTVAVTVSNGLTANKIACNGKTIMGIAEDMTIDRASATITLRYLNSTWRIL